MARLRRLLDATYIPENTFLSIMAVLVGVLAALLGLTFRESIGLVNKFLFGGAEGFFGPMELPYYVIFIPMLGGLLVGPITYFFAKEAKGHGVPEVMASVAVRGGRIRPRVAFIKAITSALTIGSGGSAGSEGPIVQIGAGLGSTLGQIFHLSEERVKTLVACGAAAGIATVFNAPIAGVFFALEVVSGQFNSTFFSLIVLSSVTASVISRAVFWGNYPVFSVTQYSLASSPEIVIYVFLGVLAGLFAVFEIKTSYFIEDMFEKWKFMPPYIKPALGGLFVGAIGIFLPQVFGTGYETIDLALAGKMSLALLVGLVFIKLIAVSVTLGSGGSGGVFAPSLFMGAMLGGAFGTLVHRLMPGMTSGPGAYALVGMGAVFAGVAHAPITSIIMLFEMTNDYRLILPLMLACVTSYALSNFIYPESIYTLKLKRAGIRLKAGMEKSVIQSIKVLEAMNMQVECVNPAITVEEMLMVFKNSHHTGYPIVDDQDKLIGIITYHDIRRAMDENKRHVCLLEIISHELVVAYPDENLEEALRKFGVRGIGRLPVVERENPQKIVGIITRSDTIRAYNRALLNLNDETRVTIEGQDSFTKAF